MIRNEITRQERSLLAEIEGSARRATAWVLLQQADSGVIGDPGLGFKYYRGPWALALMGELDAAMSVCGWIRTHLLQGDCLNGGPSFLTSGRGYRDSTLMVGAHMLQQYDLSLGLVPSLLSWQDPISGGFSNGPGADNSPSDEMDVPFAAGPGFALLATGRIEEARLVAGFLARVYEAQEDLPDRFYCFWSRDDQRPIVESDPSFHMRFMVESQEDRMQRWTVGGIAAGFLGRLYLVDPKPEYIDLAIRYQQFSMESSDAQFKYPSVCKSSWGASLLYQITGDDIYRSWLHRMAAWYLDTQEAEGWWHPWVEETSADVIEITLEFIMHLKVLQGALVARLEDDQASR